MMQVHEIEQGTPEWFALRMGKPTSSKFSTVMAKGEGKTRKRYLFDLAGEVLSGEPMSHFSTKHTERGHQMEPEARDFYAFLRDEEPELVGFVTNHDAGASPDSFVGNDGMLEIKTKLPALLLEAHERGTFPPEHKAQCQGQLWICEREWVDLICYWPKMQPLILRAHRDEQYIAKMADDVARFNDELAALIAKYSPEQHEQKAA